MSLNLSSIVATLSQSNMSNTVIFVANIKTDDIIRSIFNQGEDVMFRYLKKNPIKAALGLAVAVIAGFFMPPLFIGSAIAVVAGQVAVGVVAGLISFRFFAGLQALINEKSLKTTETKSETVTSEPETPEGTYSAVLSKLGPKQGESDLNSDVHPLADGTENRTVGDVTDAIRGLPGTNATSTETDGDGYSATGEDTKLDHASTFNI
jgi:hypothetical protein